MQKMRLLSQKTKKCTPPHLKHVNRTFPFDLKMHQSDYKPIVKHANFPEISQGINYYDRNGRIKKNENNGQDP